MAYQRGSGFVGLQQYLNANQQQAGALGGSVAGRLEGDINNTVGATGAGLNDAVARTGSLAAAGTPQYVEPTSQEDADARAQAARYTGPQGLSAEDVAAARTGISKAEEQGKYGQNDAGVATLLQQQYGQGYTGVGGRALDSFLARRGAGERLDKAGSSGMDKIKAMLGTATEQAVGIGQQGFQNAANVRQQYANWRPTPVQPTQPLVSLPPTTQQPAPGNTLGTIHVPGNTPRQTNPVTIGNTTVGAPKTPGKGGGRYIGGQWVPYT